MTLGTSDQLRAARVETDQLGFTHEKFAQYYQGVRVEHAEYTAHRKGGTIESISGDIEKISGLSTSPSLKASAALARAMAYVGATKYMWQDLGEETLLKQETGKSSASYYPQGELVIVRNARAESKNQLTLAWKFDVYAQEPVSRALRLLEKRARPQLLRQRWCHH